METKDVAVRNWDGDSGGDEKAKRKRLEKRRQNCLERYGVDHPMKRPEVMAKKVATCVTKGRSKESPNERACTKGVFTTSQVARVCRVSTRIVTKWIDSGAMAGHRMPGSKHRRIPVEDLRAFMLRHQLPMHWLEVLSS
jgi:excisionase family DNA binding protein